MGSLSRHTSGRSPFWWAIFTGADGRQCRRSTKTRDRSKAQSLCLKWEAAAKKAREGRFTEIQARKVLGDILEDIGEHRVDFVSTQKFLEDWALSVQATNAPKSAARYAHTVRVFIDHIGSKAKLPLEAVTPRMIEGLRDKEIAEGKSPVTANLLVKTIRIPFNKARRQGIITCNPADAVELLPAKSARRDRFTTEQIKSLLEVADNEWRGLILVAATAGLRLGDAKSLTWANIDLPRQVLRYEQAKDRRKEPVETILVPELEEYLMALPIIDRNPKAPLFPTLSKIAVGGKTGLSLRFRKLMAKAAIHSEVTEVTGKGRRFHLLGFHSFRGTLISTLANLGVSKEIRMALVGHKSEVHKRYTRFDYETLQKAFNGFPRFTT